MQRTIVFVLMMMYTPLLMKAQDATNYKGIKFEQGLSWEQIKEKARAQNKYIFVDCYATWCGPCKIMDKDVYPKEQIGAAMNEQFISVKVQMDTGKRDDNNIKLLYATARELEKQYKITGLPTYLFFSPEGKAVHKGMGSQTISEFIALTRHATDPDKQLYTLFHNCQSGKMSYDAMPALAEKLKTLGEDSLALEVAKAYMHGYLDKLSEDAFCKKENLEFFRSYGRMVSSKDRIFKLYFEQPDKVDAIMSAKGYSKDRINAVITREEVLPTLKEAEKKGGKISWKRIYNTIKNKYNKDYALNTVLDAKQKWYYEKGEWENYAASLMQSWKARSGDFNTYGWMYLNDIAWNLCVHSNNKKQLRTALTWINMAIPMDDKPNISMLDTKANILYKLGYKNEAIAVGRQLIALSETAYDDKEKQTAINYYQNIVAKMTKGEPIILKD